MKLLLINQSAQLDESNKQLVITFDFVDADGIVYRDTKYTPLPDDFSKSSLLIIKMLLSIWSTDFGFPDMDHPICLLLLQRGAAKRHAHAARAAAAA